MDDSLLPVSRYSDLGHLTGLGAVRREDNCGQELCNGQGAGGLGQHLCCSDGTDHEGVCQCCVTLGRSATRVSPGHRATPVLLLWWTCIGTLCVRSGGRVCACGRRVSSENTPTCFRTGNWLLYPLCARQTRRRPLNAQIPHVPSVQDEPRERYAALDELGSPSRTQIASDSL